MFAKAVALAVNRLVTLVGPHHEDDSVFVQRIAERCSDLGLRFARLQRRDAAAFDEYANRTVEFPRGGPERLGAHVILPFLAEGHRNH